LLALLSSGINAQESTEAAVADWLQKMVAAVHKLNYSGTFVFLHDNQLKSMRIDHVVDASGEKERLLSLNGVAREVFRDAASVTCVAPDAKYISIGNRVSGRSFGALFSAEHSTLARYYDLDLMGKSRVADRPAQVIAILPKDGFRYGYRLYIDQEYRLPLKTDMLDVNGQAVSQLMFTQISVHPATQVITETSLEGKEDYAWLQQTPKRAIKDEYKSKWRFNNLPQGYSVTFYSRKNITDNGVDLDHFVLSDGLAALSIYIEPSTDSGLRGASAMGTINVFGHEIPGYQITVVGEVPAITVKQIALSLYPESQQ
jgi:sigma-E factor negative regulatory protein RseB